MIEIQDCCSYLLLLRERENLRGNEMEEQSESTLALSDWAQPTPLGLSSHLETAILL